jgi:hypothetical protein
VRRVSAVLPLARKIRIPRRPAPQDSQRRFRGTSCGWSVDKLAFAVDYEKQKHVGFVGLLKELIA